MLRSNAIRKLLIGALTVLIPLIVLLGMWYPELKHHYVPSVSVDPGTVEAARHNPPDSILVELSAFEYLPLPESENLVTQAENLLSGRLSINSETDVRIAARFDDNDLDRGSAYQKLMMASLVPTAILLQAYGASGREELLEMAQTRLIGFAEYERAALIPKGLLRNDHATAARIGVLARFWKIYRNHPSYDPNTGRKVIESAYRSGEYLSKPSHFRYQSNHGIMQNIALLQLCLAFPGIPKADHYRRLAVERLGDQMGFYINDEGVVLEHSAGYQAEGMKLMATILCWLELLGDPVPEEWRIKYERGIDFLAQLRRPDNSLPPIGDTQIGSKNLSPKGSDPCVGEGRDRSVVSESTRPSTSFGLYPNAGYAVWWSGLDYWPDDSRLSQTAVAWSFFQGQGHKQADELGVWIWAAGHDWWTSAGYWPYDTRGEVMSRSWATSNAPHLLSENVADPISGSFSTARETNLLGYGSADSIVALDLRRQGPGSLQVRRQIISVDDRLWIVLDYCIAPEGEQMATVWTADSRLEVDEGVLPGSYILRSADKGKSMYAGFLGSKEPTIRRVKGSDSPFIGWQAVDRVAEPTSVITVEQPADSSWSLAASWLIDSNIEPLHKGSCLAMENWHGPENWKISIPLPEHPIVISRAGEGIQISGFGGNIVNELVLQAAPPVADSRQAVRSAFARAGDRYPYYYSVIRPRVKLTVLLLAILLFQEIFFLAWRKYVGRYLLPLRILNLGCWITGGVWLLTYYRF